MTFHRRTIDDYLLVFLRSKWSPCAEGSDAERAYVEQVLSMVRAGVSPLELATYLVETETAALGFQDTDPKTLVPLARRLLKLIRQ